MKAELGREPSDKVATRLDLDENELFQLKTEICGAYIISLDHAVSAEEGEVTIGELTSATTPSPEDAAARAEAQQQLAEAIQRLPEQERQVITLYYYDALTLKEIGDVLNLSESRICQIHRTVIKKLQGRLRIGLRDAFH